MILGSKNTIGHLVLGIAFVKRVTSCNQPMGKDAVLIFSCRPY